ncbi:putative membrane protein YdjX (TVP38/TMEM64 family) [Bacillus tianshenii]|uniref:Membrane protein YdjX (TVP38/TMEM64 family) n=1 Tax=Sutcliffiella tianshenii TaxID=1463404 RepID=A0ABS2P1G2_9BACI|nr:putative membrane protein YdjX (TVP38/TMEM64 family) [Bacillus tianshenii]
MVHIGDVTALINNKNQLPLEVFLHLLIAVTSTYLLCTVFPTLLLTYKMVFLFIIIGITLVDFFLLLGKRYEYLKITKVAHFTVLIFVLLLFLVYYLTKFLVLTDMYGMENMLRDHESTAQVIFFLICMAQPIILPIPEAVTLPAGSAVFGPFTAAYLGFMGTLAGIVLMFFIARIGGVKLASKLVKEKHLRKYQEYMGKNETVILALLFIIPILPDEIICVGAGIGAVSFKRFFIIAAITKLFTTTLLAYSVYFATALSLTNTQLVVSSSILLLVIFISSITIKRMLEKSKRRLRSH